MEGLLLDRLRNKCLFWSVGAAFGAGCHKVRFSFLFLANKRVDFEDDWKMRRRGAVNPVLPASIGIIKSCKQRLSFPFDDRLSDVHLVNSGDN